MSLDDLRLVSLFAAALGGLSHAALACGLDRRGAYSSAGVLTFCRDFAHLDALDAAALHAERTRRDLRVGRGFETPCEAA